MATPFNWTTEIEDEVLSEIMKGRSVMDICGPDRDSWTPGERTFYKHLAESPEFAQKYARARDVQAHREFDEIRQIADLATPEDVQVARLRIDARKWRASKMAPKVYGEKLELSGNAESPLTIQIVRHADNPPA